MSCKQGASHPTAAQADSTPRTALITRKSPTVHSVVNADIDCSWWILPRPVQVGRVWPGCGVLWVLRVVRRLSPAGERIYSDSITLTKGGTGLFHLTNRPSCELTSTLLRRTLSSASCPSSDSSSRPLPQSNSGRTPSPLNSRISSCRPSASRRRRARAVGLRRPSPANSQVQRGLG